MTETVGGSAKKTAARAAAKPAALKVQRVYTTEGRHPYDEVTWERRDVVMTNWRDGSVNFEQRGVEFPEFWSVNATNIVTSKYFRGAVGSEKREQSGETDASEAKPATPPQPAVAGRHGGNQQPYQNRNTHTHGSGNRRR